MAVNSKKISELPVTTTVAGLYTIGVDASNKSVRVGLEFVEAAAAAADKAAGLANEAAGLANTAAGLADKAAGLAKESAQLVEHIAGSAVVLDLAGGHTYLCGELTSLEIRSVADSPRTSIVRFRSGAVATTLTLPAELKIEGYARPEAKRTYEINIESRLGFINRF